MTTRDYEAEQEDHWVLLRDMAAHTGLAHETLRRWCQEGRIEAALVGGRYRVRQSVIRALMERGMAPKKVSCA